MAMRCGRRGCLRAALLAESALLLVGGVLLLVIGGDALASDGSRAALLAGVLLARGAAWLLVAAGSLLVLLALLGGGGALLRSRCLVLGFSSLTGVLLVLTLLVAVGAMVLTGPASGQLEAALYHSLARYNASTAATDGWDLLQSGFHCCGVHGGVDWKRNASLATAVPWSCCRRLANGTVMACEELPGATDSFYTTGCLAAAQRLFTSEGALIGGVTVGLATVMLVTTVAGCCFARNKRNDIYEQIHHK